MEGYIRNKIRAILNEEFGSGQQELAKLVTVLNALEFKDDVIAAGGEIYAVGGIVRDAIMGTPGDDLDIVVRGIPYDKLFAILSKYGNATDTSHEKEDGDKDFGSTIFISNNPQFNEFLEKSGVDLDIDVMLPRRDAKDPNVKGHRGIKSDVNPSYTIHDDLERRDITINAIAMDTDGNLITNGTGLEDIKSGTIKAVNEDAFIEDPLRMLRAIRFAARYNYDIDQTTVNLIKSNAPMLSDKQELPKERFLKEFNKMIGKSDLKRAVKMLVDFDMYKHIFGVDSKIRDFSKFDKADNIGEFAYMMFEGQPLDEVVPLINNNITNDKNILSYSKALVEYEKAAKGYVRGIYAKEVAPWVTMSKIAKLYKLSPSAMLNSSYIEDGDKELINKIHSGEIPASEHDIDLKKDDFKNFVIDLIKQEEGEFVPKRDGIKMGRAKESVLIGIYNHEVDNNSEDIKRFLEDNKEKWMS